MVVVKFGKKMVLSSLLVSSLALPSIAAAYMVPTVLTFGLVLPEVQNTL